MDLEGSTANPSSYKPPVKLSRSCSLPGEREVNHRLIDSAVRDLNDIQHQSALQTALKVGRYVVDRFFDGDVRKFRSSGNRHTSFRELGRSNELHFSSSFLWSSVAILEQLEQIPGRMGYRLPLSHHRILLGVKDTPTKVGLVRKALDEDLSKRQLYELVCETAIAKSTGKKRSPGRPRKPQALRAFDTFLKGSQTVLDLKARHFELDSRSLAIAIRLVEAIEGELVVLQEVLPEMRRRLSSQAKKTRVRPRLQA